MNQFLTNFVNTHKEILNTKKKHITATKKQVIDTLIAVLIMVAIAFVVGFITNSMENLSYVLNIINTLVFGSFVIFIVTKEKQNKIKDEHNLNILHLVLPDILHFLLILIGTNLVIQLFFLSSFVSIFNLVFYSLFFVIVAIVNEYLNYLIKQFKIRKNYAISVITGVLYNSLLFVLIIKLLPIANIMLAFTVSYLLIAILFLLKEKTYKKLQQIYRLPLFIFILIFAYSFNQLIGKVNDNFYYNPKDFFEILEYRLPSTISLEDKTPNTINVTEDFIVLIDENENLHYYNHDMEYLHTVSLSSILDNEERVSIYSVGNTIYLGVFFGDYYRTRDLYFVNDQFMIEHIGLFYDVYSNIYPIMDHYLVDSSRADIRNDLNEQVGSSIAFGDETGIIELNDSFIAYRNVEGSFYFTTESYGNHLYFSNTARYHNNKFYYTLDDRDYVCDVDDYVSNMLDQCIEISGLNTVRTFAYTGKYYVFWTSNHAYNEQVVKFFDESGSILYSIENQTVSFDRNSFIIRQDNSEYYITSMDTLPSLYITNDTPYLLDLYSLITLICLVYFVMPKHPIYGGERNV